MPICVIVVNDSSTAFAAVIVVIVAGFAKGDVIVLYSYYFDMSKVKEQFDGEFELRFSSLVRRHELDERTSFNIE